MKAVKAGLEDFVDWTGIISNEPIEEEEMSSLVAGFFVRMRKRAAGSEGETTPRSCGKRSQKDWGIILVNSLDRAPNKAGASLEEGIPSKGPPNVDKTGDKAP